MYGLSQCCKVHFEAWRTRDIIERRGKISSIQERGLFMWWLLVTLYGWSGLHVCSCGNGCCTSLLYIHNPHIWMEAHMDGEHFLLWICNPCTKIIKDARNWLLEYYVRNIHTNHMSSWFSAIFDNPWRINKTMMCPYGWRRIMLYVRRIREHFLSSCKLWLKR